MKNAHESLRRSADDGAEQRERITEDNVDIQGTRKVLRNLLNIVCSHLLPVKERKGKGTILGCDPYGLKRMLDWTFA